MYILPPPLPKVYVVVLPKKEVLYVKSAFMTEGNKLNGRNR